MFKRFTKWHDKRLKEQKKHTQNRGYEFAAGLLLRGVPSKSVSALVSVCDYNSFDEGMQDAIFAWHQRCDR